MAIGAIRVSRTGWDWRVGAAALAALVGASVRCEARQPGKTDYLAAANEAVMAGPGTQDAAAVLFPALAAMEAAPSALKRVRDASLLSPKSKDWTAWEAWASVPAQQAALEALKKITDPKVKFVLGLKYGRAGVPEEWVKAGLWVDLGEPPLLAAAGSLADYADKFDALSQLCTVEATRRASAGDGEGSLRVLVSWMRLARMAADRLFATEKLWGMQRMTEAAERMLDIARSYPEALKEKDYEEAVRELDLRGLTPERIRFPDGERMACLELVGKLIEERGGPKADVFAATMGRLTARERALMAFSEAAYWSKLAEEHAGWFDVQDQVQKVFGDLRKRWELNDLFDPLMREPTDISKMDRRRFAMVGLLTSPISLLFDARMRLVVELTGARSALAVCGYRAKQRQWPPDLSAVQPQFIARLDFDPWNFQAKRKDRGIFQYLVPIRDQPIGPREVPKPHRISVRAGTGNEELLWSVAGVDEPSGAGGAGGGGGGPMANALMANSLRDALAEGIPSKILEPATGKLDLPAFKAYVKEQLAKLAIEGATLKTMQDSVDKMDETMARGVIAMVRGGGGASAPPGGGPGAPAGAPALDPAIRAQLDLLLNAATAPELRDPATGKTDLAKFKAMMADHLKKAPVPPERRDELLKRLETIDQAGIDQMIESLKAIATMMTAGGGAGDSFTVDLTEKEFLLYSVGPNGRADLAKDVGPGGNDILIWPPVLSLEREHMTGGKR